jgi:hypothetical protein
LGVFDGVGTAKRSTALEDLSGVASTDPTTGGVAKVLTSPDCTVTLAGALVCAKREKEVALITKAVMANLAMLLSELDALVVYVPRINKCGYL